MEHKEAEEKEELEERLKKARLKKRNFYQRCEELANFKRTTHIPKYLMGLEKDYQEKKK